MAKRRTKKAPPAPRYVDGEYLVTPPAFGVHNPILGKFPPGAAPKKCLLTAAQAREFDGPDHPFTLTLVEEPALPAPPPEE